MPDLTEVFALRIRCSERHRKPKEPKCLALGNSATSLHVHVSYFVLATSYEYSVISAWALDSRYILGLARVFKYSFRRLLSVNSWIPVLR